MSRAASILMAGLALTAVAGAADASEKSPNPKTGMPGALGAVQVSAYQTLADDEMAQITGTAIPVGTYVVQGIRPDNTPYTGTATVAAQGGVYVVTWNVSGGLSYTGTGADQGNSFAVVFASGPSQVPTMTLYTVNPDNTLTGKLVVDRVTTTGTENWTFQRP